MKVEEYTRLKAKIDHLRQRKNRAEGALEQSVKRLQEKTGAATVEEAETVFVELEEKAEQAKKRCEVALEAFIEEWGEKLEEER